MLAKLLLFISNVPVTLGLECYASIVGFKGSLCKYMKFVIEKNSTEKQYHSDWLAKNVRSEAEDIKCSSNYN